MIKKALIFVFAIIGSCLFVHAQQTKEELQQRQRDLQKELNDLNSTLANIKKNKKQSLSQLYLVEQKIKAREKLVNTIYKQVGNLNEEIYQNALSIGRYKRALDTLKANYAQSLVFAYKNRSNYDYLNFIFSSTSFNDAVKRVAYLKSYRQYRESQVTNILQTQALLENKVKELANTKTAKNQALQSQNKQLTDLESDRKEKDQTVKDLKSREGDIAKEINSKEKVRRQVAQNLKAVIRREIEAAQRRERERLAQEARLRREEEDRQARIAAQKAADERDRIAREQASRQNSVSSSTAGSTHIATTDGPTPVKTRTQDRNNEAQGSGSPVAVNKQAKNDARPRTVIPPPAPKTNRIYNALESTAEGLSTSLNFENNKARLPWPVSSGNVIGEFGTHQLPGSRITEHNDGIVIAVPEGTSVKCVASGEVSGVSDMGDGQYTVFVRHGKYFSVYNNLATANVTRGDKVNAGSVLGKAGKNLDGDGEITFMITNDKAVFLNPRNWLGGR